VITTKYENKNGKSKRQKFKLQLLWHKDNKNNHNKNNCNNNNDPNLYRYALVRIINQINSELLILKAETIKPYLL
jgi:hypothetical protein